MATAKWKSWSARITTKEERQRFTGAIRRRVKLYFLFLVARDTTIVVRRISAFAVILIGTCLVPSLEAKDIIRDKSPDGRFAPRITKEDEDWGAGDHQSQNKQTSWDWRFTGISPRKRIWFGRRIHKESRISRRIDAVGVPLSIFAKARSSKKYRCRTGDFPACEEKPSGKDSGDKYLKTVEATTRPVKWLPSGDLVLEQHSESEMENGSTWDCGQTITIAFDSDHKASVKSAKQHD